MPVNHADLISWPTSQRQVFKHMIVQRLGQKVWFLVTEERAFRARSASVSCQEGQIYLSAS